MRKMLLRMIMCFALIAFSSPAFASVGVQTGDGRNWQAADIKLQGTYNDAVNNNNGYLNFTLLLAGMGNGGATSMATSDTTVDVSYGYHRKAIEPSDAAFQVGTLPDGKPGQLLTIYITERASGSWVLTPTTSTMIDTVTFDAVGETVTFLWLPQNDPATATTTGWVVWSYQGATIAYE